MYIYAVNAMFNAIGKRGRPFGSKKRKAVDVFEESSEDEIPSTKKRSKHNNAPFTSKWQ